MEEILERIKIADKDHVYIGGDQYVSFNRMCEIRADLNKEAQMLNKQLKELTDENNALKVLLKEQLVKECTEC